MKKLPYYLVMAFCLIVILLLNHILFSMGMTLDMLPVGEAFGFVLFISGMIALAIGFRRLIDRVKSCKNKK